MSPTRAWTAEALEPALGVLADALGALADGERRIALGLGLAPEAVAAIRAVERVGAVLVPVHAREEARRRDAYLDLVGADVALLPAGADPGATPAGHPPAHRRLRIPGLGEIEFVRRAAAGPRPPLPAGTDVLLRTSGTGGRPRVVCHSWETLRANARAADRRNPLGPGDAWLATLSWAHVGGLAVAVRTAQSGAAIAFEGERFDAAAVARRLSLGDITHLSVVPTMLHRLLEEGAGPGALRVVLVGGAEAPPALLDRARGAGFPIAATYGLTEAGSQVATERARTAGAAAAGLPLLEGWEARTGSEGEIEIRGPGVMLGLMGTAEPAEWRRGGWLPTGDFGVVEAGGRLLVTGRRATRIVTGGANVDPAEVEAALAEHPAVSEVCVVGVPDPVWGEVVTAVIVPRTPEGEALGLDLAGWARGRLDGPRVPRRWVIAPRLPHLPGGKVDRRSLRASLAEAPDGPREG